MKETIFKSVTAVICVIAVCVSSVLAIGKYGDAMVETAKHTPASASTSGGGSSATGGTSGGSTVDPSATPDATAPDAGTTDAATPDASTPSSGSSAGTSTGGNASSGGSSAKSTDPTKYSKGADSCLLQQFYQGHSQGSEAYCYEEGKHYNQG